MVFGGEFLFTPFSLPLLMSNLFISLFYKLDEKLGSLLSPICVGEISLQIGVLFKENFLWWHTLVKFERNPLVESSWFSSLRIFRKGIHSTNNMFNNF
jgi:hypothetical protein